jgi:hypothetical protein
VSGISTLAFLVMAAIAGWTTADFARRRRPRDAGWAVFQTLIALGVLALAVTK